MTFSDFNDLSQSCVRGELIIDAELDKSSLEAVKALAGLVSAGLRVWIAAGKKPHVLEETLTAVYAGLRQSRQSGLVVNAGSRATAPELCHYPQVGAETARCNHCDYELRYPCAWLVLPGLRQDDSAVKADVLHVRRLPRPST